MLSFDIETAPKEGVLFSRFAPQLELPKFELFDDMSVKRLVKDTDEEYSARIIEKQGEHIRKHDEAVEKAKTKHTQALADFQDEACLSPHTGRILAIGLYNGTDFKCLEGDEAEMLRTFWLQYVACTKRQEQLLGHNIRNFDLPFMVNRSKILSVRVPGSVVVKSGKYWNWSQLFVDTAEEWLLGRYPRDCKWSLDAVCYAFGLEGKQVEGIEGKGWWRHYSANRELALQYLENDCIQSYRLAERLVLSNI